jgi:uncharacterized membrane protein
MNILSKVFGLFIFTDGVMAILLPLQVFAQEGKADLTLTLFPSDYGNKVTPGKDNMLFLKIRNTGTKAITNIKLSAYKPEGWIIEFRPGEIRYLGYTSVQTVDANIKPGEKTKNEQYSVNFIVEATEIRKVKSIWVTVETRTSFWIWIGVILACIVIAGFVFIFLRSHKQ